MLKKNELIDSSLKFLEEILIYLVILKNKKSYSYHEESLVFADFNKMLSVWFSKKDTKSFEEYLNKVFPGISRTVENNNVFYSTSKEIKHSFHVKLSFPEKDNYLIIEIINYENNFKANLLIDNYIKNKR